MRHTGCPAGSMLSTSSPVAKTKTGFMSYSPPYDSCLKTKTASIYYTQNQSTAPPLQGNLDWQQCFKCRLVLELSWPCEGSIFTRDRLDSLPTNAYQAYKAPAIHQRRCSLSFHPRTSAGIQSPCFLHSTRSIRIFSKEESKSKTHPAPPPRLMSSRSLTKHFESVSHIPTIENVSCRLRHDYFGKRHCASCFHQQQQQQLLLLQPQLRPLLGSLLQLCNPTIHHPIRIVNFEHDAQRRTPIASHRDLWRLSSLILNKKQADSPTHSLLHCLSMREIRVAVLEPKEASEVLLCCAGVSDMSCPWTRSVKARW